LKKRAPSYASHSLLFFSPFFTFRQAASQSREEEEGGPGESLGGPAVAGQGVLREVAGLPDWRGAVRARQPVGAIVCAEEGRGGGGRGVLQGVRRRGGPGAWRARGGW